MWRRLRLLVIIAVLLLALGAVVVQVILWSDMPRRIAIAQIAEQTGLAVTLERFSTGWMGDARLGGLSLSLPGEVDPLLTVDSAELGHSSLVALILGSDFRIHRLTADGMVVSVRQDEHGRWSIEQAAALMAPPQTGASEPVVLPQSDIQGLRVEIVDATGRSAVFSPIRIATQSASAGAVRLDVSLGSEVRLSGRVVTRGQWSHRLELTAAATEGLGGPWLAPAARPSQVKLAWDGYLTDGSLTGRLNVGQCVVGDFAGRGTVRILASPQEVVFEPGRFQVTTPIEPVASAVVSGGQLQLSGQELQLRQIGVTTDRGLARLSGQIDWRRLIGQLQAEWVAGGDGPTWLTEGLVEARLGHRANGRRGLDLKCRGEGRVSQAAWHADLVVNADSRDWEHWNWRVEVPKGGMEIGSMARAWSLAGLSAEGEVDWPAIRLEQLRHAGNRSVGGSGVLAVDSSKWRAEIHGENVRLFAPELETIDLSVRAAGDRRTARLERLHIEGEGLEGEAKGTWALAEATGAPLDLSFVGARWTRGLVAPAVFEAAIDQPADRGSGARRPADAPAPGAAWAGRAVVAGRLTGRLDPMMLKADARVTGDQLRANGSTVDSVTASLSADLSGGTLKLKSEDLAILGGQGEISAQCQLDQQKLKVKTSLKGVELDALSRVIHPDLAVGGTAGVDLDLVLPVRDPDRLRVGGSWRVEKLTYRGESIALVTGKLQTGKPGIVALKSIEAVQGDSRAAGEMVLNLRDGVVGQAALQLQKWPITYAARGAAALVDGKLGGTIDLIDMESNGTFDLEADVRVAQQPVGLLRAGGSWSGEQVQVELRESRILGGLLSGRATVAVDQWKRSRGSFTLRGGRLAELQPWWADAQQVAGRADVALRFAPDEDPKAPEPLRVELEVTATEPLRWRHVPWGPLKATVHGGGTRWLLSDMDLALAGGSARLWLSLHKRGGQWYDHAKLSWRAVDLDQLYRVWDHSQTQEAVPGRLSGQVSLFGPCGDWVTHVGEGQIRLSDSNLRHTDVFGAVLSLLRKGEDQQPVGQGMADLRLERGQLAIDRFIYFNRGTEILMAGRVEDLRQGLGSPIEGEAIGTVRPLRDVPLPVMEDLDLMLRAFQSQLTTVRIGGTLQETVVEQSDIADLQGKVGRMLRAR